MVFFGLTRGMTSDWLVLSARPSVSAKCHATSLKENEHEQS
jgi:hypothetical protein